ncbi:alpha/beta hydrolase fold protein [Beutenbergia cavernae DSM 12333]|uniref:Alpha/beta hydrolase fold protein n=1 Tax=Beutenbergia cavernae (strain ATCC BAA-8 / DSM 12333 / CCUG 43141 / JCM 11478 / NBRC 16432 / NCIMB 13614 / HKI 0122) TaxID=471853 RepID=C5BVS6_BEUC1|nr:alpha/beta hydrolase [Beutenbergia cavernae]ACQ78516.1 alpha/beta hydrolase fold protein [Beutenbergia cavernae DSM 12333]
MTEPATHTLDVPGAVLTYDVREPATSSGAPPLFALGSPMAAGDFATLANLLDDRVVITYDPRGMERSTRTEGGPVTPETHADDYHRVVEAVGLGQVDVFASSGGALNALAWVAAHPGDLRTLVAHEPPLTSLLEDSETVARVQADIVETYERDGYGPAMAKFIQLVSYTGPLPDDYLDQSAPDPAMFGLPTEDDGSRDDLLMANMRTLPEFVPEADALRESGVRIVPATGSEGEGTVARRGGEALAALLGLRAAQFPGGHGGFVVNAWSPDNDPTPFAARLREVLAG